MPLESNDWDEWETGNSAPTPSAKLPRYSDMQFTSSRDDRGQMRMETQSNDWDEWGQTPVSNPNVQTNNPPRQVESWDDWGTTTTDSQSNSGGNRSRNDWGSNRSASFGMSAQRGRDRSDGGGYNSGGDRSTIKVNSSDVGKVIGRGGATINDIRDKSGARIFVAKESVDGETGIDVVGSAEARNTAIDLINEIIDGMKPKTQNSWQDSKQSTQTDYEPIDWNAAITVSQEATRAKWAALPPVVKEFYFEDPEVSAMKPIDVNTFRLANNNIMVSHFTKGDTKPLPNPVTNFRQAFEHYPEILNEIRKQGFETPSPIQCQSWPILLQGVDLLGIAQTGTGKTLAYLLPAMIHIDNQKMPRDKRPGPTALIMAPTRELAQQIEKEARKYSYKGIKTTCIYGGGSRRDQIGSVGRGVEIVIATPGRLNDLCMNKHIDLTSVSYLVLDEADRMLDMGFEPQIKKIMLDIRPEKHTVMMSATWPAGVTRLVTSYMNDPIQVFVGTLDLAAVHSVTQNIRMISAEQKREEIGNFIRNMKPKDKVIIFVGKKVMADELASDFALQGINSTCIHGDRDQSDREQALEDLKTGAVPILVATDVASRGLDIDDITHIFNYDFPRNIEEYVHRIGRTGRAGREGESITLMTREDWKHAQELIKILEEADQEVPPALVSMASRYGEWKAKVDAENASLGPRRGGGGGGRGGGRGGRRDRW